MIFRLSSKLSRKLHVAPSKTIPPDPNPYADWSAHLFVADRSQYIVVTNTTSLYSVLMHGRGITDDKAFIQRTVTAIREQLAEDDLLFLFERLVAPDATRVALSKALNPSVTGSLNDIVKHAKFFLVERGFSPFDTARRLTRYPMGALDYAFPNEVFAKMSVDDSEQ